jgi:hypothetical protein
MTVSIRTRQGVRSKAMHWYRPLSRRVCAVVAALAVIVGFTGLPTWADAGENTGMITPVALTNRAPGRPVQVLGNQAPRGRTRLASPQVSCGMADLSGLQTAVYVAPQGSDSPGCGTTTAGACQTVQQGLNNCSGTGCGVLVRYGLYPLSATIQLRDGVSVYGGCEFTSGPGTPYRTVVQAPPGGVPALSADGINTATLLSGFMVLGSDASTPGQASIAMTVSNSTGLTISHTVLAGGKGADGKSGQSSTVLSGLGGNGQNAPDGGLGGANCPSNRTSTAGDGGDGGTINLAWADHGPFGSDCEGDYGGGPGQDSGNVAGGAFGGTGSLGLWCPERPMDAPGDGGVGGNGGPGECGRLAQASPLLAGSFDKTSWMPSYGDDGEAGKVGSGGGGGGAGGTCCSESVGPCDGLQGLPGGGGGGGGCGGGGGGGGQQGGASIPLVLFDSSVAGIPDQNSFIPGPGGHGGDAGSAAGGWPGGWPGSGSSTGQTLFWAHWCGGQGNSGGYGGPGGSGSGGAGGNGGPSIGIALVGGSPVPPNENGIYAGQPGQHGHGGKGGQPYILPFSPGACTGPDGEDGSDGATMVWQSF